MNGKILFVKPCRKLQDNEPLNISRVIRNYNNGIETSICLDTNILIYMEQIIKNGNKTRAMKEYGIDKLVNFFNDASCAGLCLSPGLAFDEMPEDRVDKCHEAFETFCFKNLKGCIDTPNSFWTDSIYTENKGNGYDFLSDKQKITIAVPFAILIYLNFIARRFNGNPIEKFTYFLNTIEKKVDFMSGAEIEIAKYCFCPMGNNYENITQISKALNQNFLKNRNGKNPKNAEEIIKIALNGAFDLRLIQSSMLMESKGLNGVPQDCWIATADKKLATLTKVYNFISPERGNIGRYSVKIIPPELHNDPFWVSADREHFMRTFNRKDYFDNKKMKEDELISIANNAQDFIKKNY